MIKIKDPIKEMVNFHKEVYKKLDMLEEALNKFKKDRKKEDLRLSLDGFFFFVRKYLALHIKDEEEALFPVLESTGNITKGIEQIVNEHEVVQASIETLKLIRGMDVENYKEIEEKITNIINTIRNHSLKEEELVFMPAEKNLTEKQKAFVAEKMNEFRSKTEK